MYSIIDFEVTLRCNGACKDCLRFCGYPQDLGLDYSNSDLTEQQVMDFICQVKDLGLRRGKPVISLLIVSGGEPLLHPNIKEIVNSLREELVKPGFIQYDILVNSNFCVPIPEELKPFVLNYSLPKDNVRIHRSVFTHPDDLGCPRPNFKDCNYTGKPKLVFSSSGFNVCCVADGLIRLFDQSELFLKSLPDSYEDFPLGNMNSVCQHCVFGTAKIVSGQEAGNRISSIFLERIQINKTRKQKVL